MSKRMMKQIINEKINKDKIYNYVINNYDKKNNKKMISYISVFAVIIIVIFIYFKNTNNEKKTADVKTYSATSSNDEYIVREIDIKDINTFSNYSSNNIDIKSLINNIVVPKNVGAMNIYAIYSKDEKGHYVNIYEYNIIYSKNNMYLKIAFSSKNIPLNNIQLDEIKENIVKINNQYISSFKHKNYNFYIESENISKDDVLTLIDSIKKE